MNSVAHKSQNLNSYWSLCFIAQPTLGANEVRDTMKGVA
jgi:hypothetical protein